MAQLKKYLLLITGFISLALGVLGIILPLLPTTPFLLLAAACFYHSSSSLHAWLIGHRLLGDFIKPYQRFRAVSTRARFLALFLLWSSIGYSTLVVVSAWWLKAGLILIAIGVSFHLARLRTLTPEMREQLRNTPL